MKPATLWPGLCLLALLTSASTLALGNGIEQLQASGHLRIDSAISPREGIVPGQKVELILEIATDSWFTGGTRIGIPEVPGLVVLQTEQFASNASETRNGQTWVIQRWVLDVFPQRVGDFTIGPIPLQLKVNAGSEGEVQGELLSPARQFTVALPASLDQVQHWVAAPAFTVSQSFDRQLDDLAVGDAFEQEILFEASDVLAMMLPRYETSEQPGLAVYPAPPVLDNTVNRGQSQASHRMRISYVVEQPGEYVLPAREYFWWNTRSAELELLSLPETRIAVSGANVARDKAGITRPISPGLLLALSVGLVLAAAALRLGWVYLPRLALRRWATYFSALVHRLRALLRPALATRLNPGSSAEDGKA